ncbi:hypothetical protein E2C01_098569 [Portunus trituberculatus]|uniref:Uncharacterized protein n=1 Tax=Portunus trituberculatus TaxID=210409 RepID=A0A5B7K7B3_PORTR|nr:hypothetical protein [Portunus trituberculatus]
MSQQEGSGEGNCHNVGTPLSSSLRNDLQRTVLIRLEDNSRNYIHPCTYCNLESIKITL